MLPRMSRSRAAIGSAHGRRLGLALACTAACGARLGSDGPGDAPRDTQDPPADAAIDARPCVGGDARMSTPSGVCYFLFTTPATYADAKASCAAAGGRLAIIRNSQDDVVAQMLVGTTLDAFIGLSDQVTEGTFVWEDGSALLYANWYPTEPNDGGGNYPEDCGVINGRRGGSWDDRPCEPIPNVGGGLYAYLCES